MSFVERHRRNVRSYQRDHRKRGLCILCPLPAVTADYCERHQRETNTAKRERYASRIGKFYQPTVRFCPACGQPHHNIRTCLLAKYLQHKLQRQSA